MFVRESITAVIHTLMEAMLLVVFVVIWVLQAVGMWGRISTYRLMN